jgi:hypothetical protein
MTLNFMPQRSLQTRRTKVTMVSGESDLRQENAAKNRGTVFNSPSADYYVKERINLCTA